jgi:hypothetical protein
VDSSQECQDEEEYGKEREDKRPHGRDGCSDAADSGQTECKPGPPWQRKRRDEDQRAAAAERSEPEEKSAVTAAENPHRLGDAVEDEADTQREGKSTSPSIHGLT